MLKTNPQGIKVAAKNGEERLYCNDISDSLLTGVVSNHTTSTMSNWSVADEIKRLIKINSVSPLKINYQFHIEDCPLSTDPINTPKDFHKRDQSTAGSQKYRCKECGKITNVTLHRFFNLLSEQCENEGKKREKG